MLPACQEIGWDEMHVNRISECPFKTRTEPFASLSLRATLGLSSVTSRGWQERSGVQGRPHRACRLGSSIVRIALIGARRTVTPAPSRHARGRVIANSESEQRAAAPCLR